MLARRYPLAVGGDEFGRTRHRCRSRLLSLVAPAPAAGCRARCDRRSPRRRSRSRQRARRRRPSRPSTCSAAPAARGAGAAARPRRRSRTSCDLSRRDGVEALDVPHEAAGERRHPPPPQDVPERQLVSAPAARCKRRGGRGVAIGDQQREPVEQQVERTRRTSSAVGAPGRRGRSPSRTPGPATEPAISAAPQAAR